MDFNIRFCSLTPYRTRTQFRIAPTLISLVKVSERLQKSICNPASHLCTVLLFLLEEMSALPAEGSSTDDPWEVHRETIRRLYLVENKSLKEVRNVMENSPYNFIAS
jgi:hypothetical protein